jgi:putative endonuclease
MHADENTRPRNGFTQFLIGVYRRASAVDFLYRLADAARNLHRSRHTTPEQARMHTDKNTRPRNGFTQFLIGVYRRASAADFLYRLADAARNLHRSRHTTPEQAHGRRGEDLAHRFLRRQGLTIVARNFHQRSGRGELDIVAWDRQTLVFVEVKSRASAEFGSPGRAVGTDKERDLRRAAGEYLRRAGAAREQARFDLVNIILTKPPRIEWIKDAFPISRTL